MEFRRVWTLRGPNYWANFPVIEALVDLGEWKDRSSEMIPGFNDRLKSCLPSLIEHRCSVGERGGFFQRLERGTYFAHILEHVTLELQTLAGSNCGFGRARELENEDGVYKVAIEYEEDSLARECMETGRRLILAAALAEPFDIEAEITRLKEISYDVRLGPSTMGIVRSAKARGIPYRRLNKESLVQLGYGAKGRRICTAESDRTSAIAETVAQDKDLTRMLLRSVGVAVPEGRPVTDADDAWNAAQELGLPVVVKPQYGNHGRGVQTNLSTKSQVQKAYEAAREESRHIMVEQFIEGVDHRLLVIGDRLIAAAVRNPAHVKGDGKSTVRKLVDEVNKDPRRSDGHSTVLSFIKLDTIGLEVLAEQGYTPDSIPPAGQTVLIRRNGNLSTGGTANDVTDLVHPEVAARAVEAARVVGLDIAGVDIVARDISLTLEDQRGAVVEVNAGPGLRMHIEPTEGKPRPVGDAIISLLYPEGENGRIPIIGITGTKGKTTVAKMLSKVWQHMGQKVGMACSAGTFAVGRCLDAKDSANCLAARNLLLNPMIEVGIFEASTASIMQEGLGFDRCDVGIVTNLGPADQLDFGEMETLEKFVRLKRAVIDVVLPTGFAVLNADDPLVITMNERCKGATLYYAKKESNPVVVKHRANSGRALFIRNDLLVYAEGEREEPLFFLSDVCKAEAGDVATVENILAAVSAAYLLNVPRDTIKAALAE